MKRQLQAIAILILTSVSVFAADNPEEWVQKADNIRNPADSYEMTIKVTTPENTSIYHTYLKGQDKTLIVTKEPARDKGRNMLMLDRDFYAYIPNLKRSMRLSLSQKLSGQVANGDISRTRWYGDYAPQIEKNESSEVQLLLKGKKENLTYAWVRLWLKKPNFQPDRAEYLALNGKTILKRARFENYKTMAGALRPTMLTIEDTDKKSSSIEIQEMNKKDMPDSFFTNRNMETLR